jgi:site-specific recombinase XerD
MVTIFRRHYSAACPGFGNGPGKGREYQKCDCPFWADARPVGKLQSLKTSDRAEALRMARDIELNGGVAVAIQEKKAADAITIEQAGTEFLAGLKFKNLKSSTVQKHKTMLKQIAFFAAGEKIRYVRELDTAACIRFSQTWQDGITDEAGIQIKKTEGALAAGKKLERLRQFFKFCVLRKWIEENPTTGIASPIVDEETQAEPFEPEDQIKVLTAARAAVDEARSQGEKMNCTRMVALILLARYSGLRIGDVVSCRTEWVSEGRVRRRAQKNNAKIDIRLPDEVIEALNEAPVMSPHYWFWTNKCTLKTAVGKWQFRMLKLFRAAGIVNGHPHRFRHTFAVSLLEQGYTLQTVADALGDTLEVAQKHYSGWSKTRRDKMDAAVSSTWTGDSLLQVASGKRGSVTSIKRKVG